MATLGDPTEVDRLALQIEALRAEIRTLESHQKDIATVQSFNIKHLSKFKSGFRQEALKQAEMRRAELERLGVSHIMPPPNLKTQTTISGQKIRGGRGGEWDAYNNLSPQEKSRLRKNWMSQTGHAPDQMALEMGVDSSDQAFETFLNHSRQIDLLEYYGKTGRMPKNFQGYGGKEIDSSFLDHLNIDLRILHDSDLTPTQQLNYLKEQMIGMAELEIDRHLPNGLRPIEDAVSEKYKLDKQYKAHVEAMNAHLAQREASVTAPRTEAQIKLEKIKRAKETKLNDIARREEKAKSTINVGRPLKSQAEVNREAAIARGRAPKNKTGITAGRPVPQKATQTQAQINLEAAKARGRAAGPVDEAAEYALKDAAGYFNDDYFSAIDEMAYADDIISETFEVLDAPVAAIASSGKTAASSSAAAVSSAVTKGAPTATRASATLSSAVSKGGKNAHLNLKTAAAASALGLAGGYVANRKRTRR